MRACVWWGINLRPPPTTTTTNTNFRTKDNFEAEIAVGRHEFKAGMGIISHKCSIKKNSSQAGYGKEVPMKLGVGCRLSKERTHPC